MSTERVLTTARPRGRGIRKFGLVEVSTPPSLPLSEIKDRARNFVNDIQLEAKEEVPKNPVPAKPAAASGKSGESPGAKSSSSASSTTPKPLKTPAAFLNEICAKSCSKCTYQFDNVGNPGASGYFKCTVVVTAKNGNIIEGTAFGISKQVAKQEAARDLLINLDPQTDSFLTPKDPSKLEAVEERQGGQLEKETRQSQKLPEALVEKEGDGTANGHADLGNAWEQDVIYMRSADGTITLAIPRQLAIQQLSPYQIQPQLSLEAKTNIVRGWNGPKIQRLKGMNPSKISQLKKPSEVAEKISESEGLALNYLLIKLDGEEGGGGAQGGNRYHCILEAKDSTMSYFTHSGFGESQEDAMNKAALNYIQMLWSIISAV